MSIAADVFFIVCRFYIFSGVFSLQLMEEKILAEGEVLPGGILKVGSFLNQQIDVAFLRSMAAEVARLFDGCGVNKILTIESSGIAIATAVGLAMNAPVVFAKKHKTSNVDGDVYSATVHSFTHNIDNTIMVSKDYLTEKDCVLIVDDFLAAGNALKGLIALCRQAGAKIAGCSCAIEKGFQKGGDEVRAMGIRCESLAIIDEMNDTDIKFRS